MTTPARQTLRDWSRRLTVDAIDPADRPAFERALQQIIRRSKPLAGEMPDEFSDN